MRFCKKIISILLIVSFLLGTHTISFAESSAAGQETRTQVLYLAGIIENDLGLGDLITRRDFARMIAKASPYKDSVGDTATSSAYSDVKVSDKNASYIKLVGEHNYMSTYLGGKFKPNDGVTYKELVRSCLTLLGYTNEDFEGDQVNGRYQTFCNLYMNEYISSSKNQTDPVTKQDAINAIYAMLKAKKKQGEVYGTSVFNMTTDSKGELNASGLLRTKMQGPFILKANQSISSIVPFAADTANVFLNGMASNNAEISRAVANHGFMIVYYNEPTHTIYGYQEGTTPDSTMIVKSGYVNYIYYKATDQLTPTSVDIDLVRYTLDNNDMRIAFSYSGTIHVDDRIVFVAEKVNNSGDGDEEADAGIVYGGNLIAAYLYETTY